MNGFLAIHKPYHIANSFLQTYPIFCRPKVLASVENNIENENNKECDVVSCQSSNCAELSIVNNIEPG